MKIVIAQMQHETNTFSPVPTPWEAFGKDGPALGKAAYEATKGTRVPMAAFLDLAEAAGAEIVTPLAAWANPSGPVDGKAYDRFCDVIGEAVSKGCDAIFLDLHGAMVVADRTDDGEGTLLQKIRSHRAAHADRRVSGSACQRHWADGAQLRRYRRLQDLPARRRLRGRQARRAPSYCAT